MAKAKFTISIDDYIIKQLKKRAVDEGKNSSSIIQELLEQYLNIDIGGLNDYRGKNKNKS